MGHFFEVLRMEKKGHNVFVERGEATALQVAATEEIGQGVICTYPAGTRSSVILDGNGLASNGFKLYQP